jgi:hypothetical protein
MKKTVVVLVILAVIICFLSEFLGDGANKSLDNYEPVASVESQLPKPQKVGNQTTPERQVTLSSVNQLESNVVRSSMSVIPDFDENDDELSLFESGAYSAGVIFPGEPLYDYLIPSWDGTSKYIYSPLYQIEVSVVNGSPMAIIVHNEEYYETNSVDFDTNVANDIQRLLESKDFGADSPQKEEHILDLINDVPLELGYLSVRTLHCKERLCILVADTSSKEAYEYFRSKVAVDATGGSLTFPTEDHLLVKHRIEYN